MAGSGRPRAENGGEYREEVLFVLTMVIFFLKCFVGAWAEWILGPALNGHSPALRT